MSRRPLAVLAMAIIFVVMAVGVAYGAVAPYDTNSECFECHQGGSAMSQVDFTYTGTVDRATACPKCHWEPAGGHPFHGVTGGTVWACGSCHAGWGAANTAAFPQVNTPNGYFFSAASANVDSATLHVIHSNASWPAQVNKSGRVCASCHAAAACTACHTGAIDPTHADHTYDAGLGDYWPGSGPSPLPMGSGTPAGNEYVSNLSYNLGCSNGTCHDISSGASEPFLIEDSNAGVIFTGTWGRSSQAGYSGNTYRIANAVGAKAEYKFNGQKVQFITDRGPYRGKAKILIDSVEATTVNLYNATLEKQFVAFTSATLSSADHTITVQVVGTVEAPARGAFVVMDAFKIYPKLASTLTDCIDCHDAANDFLAVNRSGDHGAPAADHEPSDADLSCTTASSCHQHDSFYNIATGHLAADPSYNCLTCHANASSTIDQATLYLMNVTKECTDCHNATYDLGPNTTTRLFTESNHGGNHLLDSAANVYGDATGEGAESGCTGAGGGCHGNTAFTSVTEPHPNDTTCLSGQCHTSVDNESTTPGANFKANMPYACVECHDAGLYEFAVDVNPVASTHYSAALHTASGGLGNVKTQGGPTVAACSVCHDLALGAAHTGIASASGTKVTCAECHSYSAQLTSEVKTANWTANACADCHKSGAGYVTVQHAADVATVVNATTYTGCGNTGANCHDSIDLHSIHKGNGVGTDPACSVSGCHDASNKNKRPTLKTCGQAAGCHPSAVYTPSNHGVITGTEATHTAGADQATVGQGDVTCADCHYMAIGTEHAKTLSGSMTCVNCHNNTGSTDAITGNWADRNSSTACAACHDGSDIASQHGNMAGHTVTNTGCSATGGGCHASTSLSSSSIHVTCLNCHSIDTYDASKKTCGNAGTCHDTITSTAVHYTGNTAEHAAASLDTSVTSAAGGTLSARCDQCHNPGTGNLSTQHTDLGGNAAEDVTCDECHNYPGGNIATIVKDSWSTDSCAECHTFAVLPLQMQHATAPAPGVLGTVTAGNTVADECDTCHGGWNLHEIHKGSADSTAPLLAEGCAATDGALACHNFSVQAGLPTVKSCGEDNGGCHLNKNDTNHGAAHTLTDTPYNNTTVSGCLGVSAGCHGAAGTNYAATQYHQVAGVSCKTSKCHDAGATNHSDPEFKDPNSCTDCHGGGAVDYVQAPLVSNLLATVGAAEGHYDPTLHDATGMANTINAGGTASAACSACHALGASGLTQLYNQHQDINATPAPPVGGGFSDDFNTGSFVAGGWTADYQPATAGTVIVASENFDNTTNWVPGSAPPAPWVPRGTTYTRYTATTAAFVSSPQAFSLGRTTAGAEYVDWGPWNTTGGAATLTFKARAAQASVGTFQTSNSVNGITTYTTVSPALTTSWQTYTISVPSNAALTLRWNYVTTASQFVYFDDVELSIPGTPAAEDGWNVVTNQARAIGGDATTRVLKKTAIDTSNAGSIDFTYDLGISGFEAGDSLAVQYSPDGSAWTTQDTYTANRALATVTKTLPVGTTAIQFVSVQNASDDLVTLDNVVVTPVAQAPSAGLSLTCADCHSTAPTVVTGNWATATCAECHDGAIAEIQHSTLPTTNGTTTGQCGSASCHGTLDLHQLHKGDGVDSDGLGNPSCNQTGCHDSSIQAMWPTTLACGAAGCHDSGHMAVPHYANYAAGVTSQSITYQNGTNAGCFTSDTAGCHFSDLTDEHAERTNTGADTGCGICHGTAFGTTAGDYAGRQNVIDAISANDKRCTTCHNETSDAVGNGVQQPHTTAEKVTGGTNMGDAYEWQDWTLVANSSDGGGHNSFSVMYPKTTGWGTVNGVTPGTIAFGYTFDAPWTVGSMVRCNDCHIDTVPTGPQGASVPWYLTADSDGTPAALNVAGGSTIGSHWYTTVLSGGTSVQTTVFCSKCHNTWSGANVHNRSDHYERCDACHIRIPHAWKRPRLLRRTTGGTIQGVPVDTLPYADPAQTTVLEGYNVTAGQTNFSSGGSCVDRGTNGCGQHATAGTLWP